MSFESLIDGLNVFCDYLGGPLMVALFYWFRFHSLKGTRSYTTRALYYFGVATFILPFIFIYHLLLMQRLSPLAAILVLIFIWLAPVLPGAWRNFCHKIARIPSYAYALRDVLATASFELRPEDMSVIRRKLGRFGYQIDDFRAVQSTAIQSRFLKIAAVMHHLEQWNLKGEAFMERNSEHYSDLLHVFDLQSFKTIRALKNAAAIYGAIMEESKVQPDDWHALDSLATQDNSTNVLQSAAQTAAGCMLEDLRKDMDFLLDNLLLFVARAALAGERNFAGRKRRLEAIGFTTTRPAAIIMPTVVASVAITVVCSLIWFVAMGDKIPIIGDKSVGITRLFVLPSLNLIVNFLLVYHFKRNYAFANEGMFGEYPIVFILSIGILTALLMFPFRTGFDYLQFPDEDFAHVLVRGLPLSLFPWVTGAVSALLVQDSIWSGFKSERTKRIMDGITFGAGMVLVILLLWTIHKITPIPQMQGLDRASLAAIIGGVFGYSFAFGFAIGYFVIARVREVSSLRRAYKGAMSSGALMRV